MKENIKVIIVAPGKEPQAKMVPNTLEAFREIVGGPIETSKPFTSRVMVVCHAEGRVEGFAGNRMIGGCIYVGTIAVVGVDSFGEFKSLNDEQIGRYMSRLMKPESFTQDEIDENAYILWYEE